MQRRAFLAKGATALAATAGIAGCISFGGSSPPPRRSDVFDRIAIDRGTLQVALVDQPTVESRADVDGAVRPARASLLAGIDLGDLSPVGVARAGKGASGRGTGGYGTAPKTDKGRAKLYGGDYADDWREDHRSEITQYAAALSTLGIAYLGPEEEFEDNPPGPGPADEWDETMSPDPGTTVTYPVDSQGWYRVGAELAAKSGNHNFGWESVDFKVDSEGSGYRVEKQWKVSPRL